ncbi:MAG: aspartate/tyrosine/aromatic aminotransferase [Gammaproteobacteria bacterium]|nr:aspartate/tyrosine/aromatic aminotransferase [Gammaproteobacteria bacterium]
MFETLKALNPDPILGLMAAYRHDGNPRKVDLGVGVYKDEAGHTPIMASVLRADAVHRATETSKTYVGPTGDAEFNREIQALIFGIAHPALTADRVRTVQAPGGCGALRVAAELINRARPGAAMWVSDPTWANHVPLLGDAGLEIKIYPYYDAARQGLKVDAMLSALDQIKAGDLVLLHGCCHNPCGVDLNEAQWDAVAALAAKRGFTPFVDLAYLGLGLGLEQDVYGVRKLAASVPELIVASSCSKNFGLYRERVGALSIVSPTVAEAEVVHGQVQNVARGIYSMPPNYGAALVGRILGDPALRQEWDRELTEMRDRINALRADLAKKFSALLGNSRFDFIPQQRGMFSFLGLNKNQVQRLKTEYGIYMVDSSRINVAGINKKNIDYFCEAVCAIL